MQWHRGMFFWYPIGKAQYTIGVVTEMIEKN